MKRSFKAATVFAGAGAMTGVFAPAALAAPAHTITAAKPDINPARPCGANNGGVSQWAHFFYPGNDHPAECIGGGKGTLGVDATIYSFCPGNNSGKIFGTYSFDFGAGSPRQVVSFWDFERGNDHVSGIHISRWTGNAKCT
jgi:hypothetical protein